MTTATAGADERRAVFAVLAVAAGVGMFPARPTGSVVLTFGRQS